MTESESTRLEILLYWTRRKANIIQEEKEWRGLNHPNPDVIHLLIDEEIVKYKAFPILPAINPRAIARPCIRVRIPVKNKLENSEFFEFIPNLY